MDLAFNNKQTLYAIKHKQTNKQTNKSISISLLVILIRLFCSFTFFAESLTPYIIFTV